MTGTDLVNQCVTEMNEQKVREAKSRVNTCVQHIIHQQAVIKAAKEKIEQYKKELKEISVTEFKVEELGL